MLDILLVIVVCTAFLLGLIWLVQRLLPKAINPPNEKTRPLFVWVVRMIWIALLFSLWNTCVITLLMGETDLLYIVCCAYLTIYLPFSIYKTILPWLEKPNESSVAAQKVVPSETGDA